MFNLNGMAFGSNEKKISCGHWDTGKIEVEGN
jgi:hypothetical protein